MSADLPGLTSEMVMGFSDMLSKMLRIPGIEL